MPVAHKDTKRITGVESMPDWKGSSLQKTSPNLVHETNSVDQEFRQSRVEMHHLHSMISGHPLNGLSNGAGWNNCAGVSWRGLKLVLLSCSLVLLYVVSPWVSLGFLTSPSWGAELGCQLVFSKIAGDSCQDSLSLGSEVSGHHFCFTKVIRGASIDSISWRGGQHRQTEREGIDDGHWGTGMAQGKHLSEETKGRRGSMGNDYDKMKAHGWERT